MTKKLQNFFSDFLPQKYGDFTASIPKLRANPAVVAELLRICCEENNVKAIQLAFERILGKPEKVITIKRTVVRMIYPDAKRKALQPDATNSTDMLVSQRDPLSDKTIIDQNESPGALLKAKMDFVGDEGQDHAYKVVDKKNGYSVAEVLCCNLYTIAMRGGNLSAINLLFDYLDGAVADVVRLEGEDMVVLENFADVAPYEAVQGVDGVWHVDTEAVG